MVGQRPQARDAEDAIHESGDAGIFDPGHVDQFRQHLVSVHPTYVAKFDELLQRAREQRDE